MFSSTTQRATEGCSLNCSSRRCLRVVLNAYMSERTVSSKSAFLLLEHLTDPLAHISQQQLVLNTRGRWGVRGFRNKGEVEFVHAPASSAQQGTVLCVNSREGDRSTCGVRTSKDHGLITIYSCRTFLVMMGSI
jgi:hypothetical protein